MWYLGPSTWKEHHRAWVALPPKSQSVAVRGKVPFSSSQPLKELSEEERGNTGTAFVAPVGWVNESFRCSILRLAQKLPSLQDVAHILVEVRFS